MARSKPRDANITAAANAGRTPKALDSKLTIEGNFSTPPLPEETLWAAARALTHLEKTGVIDEDAFRELICAYGLDVLHKPKAAPSAAPVGPMSFACPDCGSVPKKRCRSVNGIERGGVHIARRRLAEQHTEETAA